MLLSDAAGFLGRVVVCPLLSEVRAAAQHLNRSKMREILVATVEEFEPALDIKDLLWETATDVAAVPSSADKLH